MTCDHDRCLWMSMIMLMLMQCSWLTCKLTLGVLQGPWPNTKALSVSDQKYKAAISSDSFLSISARDNLMHWFNFRSPHWTSFEWLTLKNQSFHPLVGLGEERKASFYRSREKFLALKGTLFVSAFIRSVGFGFPSGPRHWRWGWSVGITILSAKS